MSLLDRPEILQVVFHPRKSQPKPLPPNARDHFVEVEKGTRIGCRFFTKHKSCPSLLYFHGNGEVVDDYDQRAHLFNDTVGVNLFVASYRGYGLSDGTPTMTNLFADSHLILKGFKKVVEDLGFRKSFFVLGASLGSLPAIQIAYDHQDDIHGLIVDSGPSNNFKQGFVPIFPPDHPLWREDSKFLNKVKLRSIQKPTLIIHGEKDSLFPVKEGKELYANSASKDKRLVIVPNAEHGEGGRTMGIEHYHNAIAEFVRDYS